MRAAAFVITCAALGCNVATLGPSGAGGAGASAGGSGAAGGGGEGGGDAGGPGCTPGESAACYEGPEGTADVGICRSGLATCADDGSAFGPCVGQVLPLAADNCAAPGDLDCNGTSMPCMDDPLWSHHYDGGVPSALALGGVAIDPWGRHGIVGFGDQYVLYPGATLESSGFVAMLDATGAECWVLPLRSPVSLSGIAYDAEGSMLVAGSFREQADFDCGMPLEADDATNIALVAKLNPAGGCEFDKRLGTPGIASAAARAAASPSGEIVVVASGDSVSFGGETFEASAPAGDIFIGKLDKDGEHVWSKQAHTSGGAALVAVDGAGFITLAGSFTGSIDLGAGPEGGPDAGYFVARLAPDGAPITVRALAGDATVVDLETTPDGEVVVAGRFTSADFGDGVVDPGAPSAFVAVYSPDLSLRWSATFPREAADALDVTAAAFSPTRDVVVVGALTGALSLDGAALTSAGGSDIAVLRYDADGALAGSRTFGGPSDDTAAAARVDTLGSPVVLGSYFSPELDFGQDALGLTGSVDIFLAKIAP